MIEFEKTGESFRCKIGSFDSLMQMLIPPIKDGLVDSVVQNCERHHCDDVQYERVPSVVDMIQNGTMGNRFVFTHQDMNAHGARLVQQLTASTQVSSQVLPETVWIQYPFSPRVDDPAEPLYVLIMIIWLYHGHKRTKTNPDWHGDVLKMVVRPAADRVTVP